MISAAERPVLGTVNDDLAVKPPLVLTEHDANTGW
jgi:hypothetical protein